MILYSEKCTLGAITYDFLLFVVETALEPFAGTISSSFESSGDDGIRTHDLCSAIAKSAGARKRF